MSGGGCRSRDGPRVRYRLVAGAATLVVVAAAAYGCAHRAMQSAVGPAGPVPPSTGMTTGIPPAARVKVSAAIKGTAEEVRLLFFGGQRGEADTLAQRLVARAERRHGPQSLEAAEALDLLVWVIAESGIGTGRIGRLQSPRIRERVRPLARRAFAIKDSLLAPGDPRRARSLDHLAQVAWFDGDTASAWSLAGRSLAFRERALGHEHAEVALSLRLLGQFKELACDGAGALDLYERTLLIQDRTVGPIDLEIARTLSLVADVSIQLGRPYRAAVDSYRRIHEICSAELGPTQYITLGAMMGLGQFLNLVSPAEAESLDVHVIQAAEAVLGPRHWVVARMHAHLIDYYTMNFDLVKGRQAAEEGVRRFPWDYFLMVMAIGFYEVAGDYDRVLEAAELGVQAVENKAGPYRTPRHLASALERRGRAHLLSGSYEKARENYARARKILDGLPERQTDCGMASYEAVRSRAFVRHATADLLVQLGEYKEGKSEYRAAMAELDSMIGAPGAWEHTYMAVVRGRFGEALLRMGNPVAALEQFEAGARAWGTEGNSGNPIAADMILGQARAQVALGDHPAARELFTRFLALRDPQGDGEHPALALALRGLARVEQAEGRLDQARASLERAVRMQEAIYGPAHPDVAASLQALATVELERGEARAALAAATRAEESSREHSRLVVPSLSERQALGFTSIRPGGLNAALAAAVTVADGETARESWNALIRSRAMVLDELATRRQVVRLGGDAEAESLARALGRARTRLANLTVREGGWAAAPEDTTAERARQHAERIRAVFRAAQQEKERLEEALAARSAEYRREQERIGAGYAEVAGALPPRSALVAYTRYEPPDRASGEGAHYAAFVLEGGEALPVLVPLGAALRIEREIRDWREESGRAYGSEVDVRRAGEALRARVWDPVARRLAEADRVYIVPDGALSLVSFVALPDAGGQYLVETGPTLHVLSAERDLVMSEDGAGSSGMLALGDPQFDGLATGVAGAGDIFRGPRSGCRALRTERFARLPETAIEVEALGALWGGSGAASRAELLLGPEASEGAFKARAPGHRVLHVATHGYFLGGDCKSALDSRRGMGAIVTADAVVPPLTEIGENPLLLSGLALAGANRRDQASPSEEDGILTAEEIASLDLSGVEWAVLSACETGVGEVRAGEGVFGLRRAFQVAGARTLIMSLWSVEDEATRAWMTELYRARLERGLDTAESVRAASLAVLAERRARGESTHPFYWGAFVAAGDWR